MAKKNLLPLLVTIGDPNGIGPEIAVSLWKMKHSVKRPIALVGDFQVVLSALALKGISKEAVLDNVQATTKRELVQVLSNKIIFELNSLLYWRLNYFYYG